MMKRLTAVWKRHRYEGMEHLSLRHDENGLQADSVVIGVDGAGAFRLDYHVTCDAAFATREVRLTLAGQRPMYLSGDGHGSWFDSDGRPVPALMGCIDIDISATPFTNTLPVRRLTWLAGQTETLRMVYFSIPEMSVHSDEQRYTCLEQIADGAVFRFEQVSTGFSAYLPVDADGLVLDYPGLFWRV